MQLLEFVMILTFSKFDQLIRRNEQTKMSVPDVPTPPRFRHWARALADQSVE
jgi:hypothetical protein